MQVVRWSSTAFLCTMLLVGASGRAQPVRAQSAGEWRSGEAIYRESCRYCHDTGVGVVITGRKLAPEYIAFNVRNGMGAMPSFRQSELPKAELERIVRYVAESE